MKHILIFQVFYRSKIYQKLNLLPEEVINGKCLKIELNFLDDITDYLYAEKIDGDVDFILTKTKVSIIFSNNNSTCCSMCICSAFKFINFSKESFQRHKELWNLGWCANYFVEDILTIEQ